MYISSVWLFFNDKLLLVFHKKQQRWLPVAGHALVGEQPHETAVREVKEETGLDVVLLFDAIDGIEYGCPFRVASQQTNDGLGFLYEYVGSASSDAVTVSHEEFEQYVWLTYEEFCSFSLESTVRAVGLRAFAVYQNNV